MLGNIIHIMIQKHVCCWLSDSTLMTNMLIVFEETATMGKPQWSGWSGCVEGAHPIGLSILTLNLIKIKEELKQHLLNTVLFSK